MNFLFLKLIKKVVQEYQSQKYAFVIKKKRKKKHQKPSMTKRKKTLDQIGSDSQSDVIILPDKQDRKQRRKTKDPTHSSKKQKLAEVMENYCYNEGIDLVPVASYEIYKPNTEDCNYPNGNLENTSLTSVKHPDIK